MDPAVAFAIGLMIGTGFMAIYAYVLHYYNNKGWRILVNDLIRQRTHLVGQRFALQNELSGLAKAGEAVFSLALKSIETLTEDNLRSFRRLRSTLDRAEKHQR